ncbi:MAG: pseudouridine synthase [Candidatus Fibromonas sp.]|jgi:16S rRNA pseudouridine516 synthase|nr:pseudouridine synthase [Candidatus Fibromonas sp.]
MKSKPKVYIKLNKPHGYECSHAPTDHESIFSLFPPELVKNGLQCAGRLDYDTTGLILLSNDGEFIHKIEHPKKGFAKTYIATLAEPLTEEMQKKLLAGVQLRNEKYPCAALELNLTVANTAEITIKGGVYHQVKRMFAAVGNKVIALHRSKIGDYELGELKAGEWELLL